MNELKIGDKVYCKNFGEGCIGRVIDINNEKIIVKLISPIRRLVGNKYTFKKIY